MWTTKPGPGAAFLILFKCKLTNGNSIKHFFSKCDLIVLAELHFTFTVESLLSEYRYIESVIDTLDLKSWYKIKNTKYPFNKVLYQLQVKMILGIYLVR